MRPDRRLTIEASTGRRIVLDQHVAIAPTTKGSQPLDRVSPMQRGFEAALGVLFGLGHPKLPYSGYSP
jgi:hypothetical protein